MNREFSGAERGGGQAASGGKWAGWESGWLGVNAGECGGVCGCGSGVGNRSVEKT